MESAWSYGPFVDTVFSSWEMEWTPNTRGQIETWAAKLPKGESVDFGGEPFRVAGSSLRHAVVLANEDFSVQLAPRRPEQDGAAVRLFLKSQFLQEHGHLGAMAKCESWLAKLGTPREPKLLRLDLARDLVSDAPTPRWLSGGNIDCASIAKRPLRSKDVFTGSAVVDVELGVALGESFETPTFTGMRVGRRGSEYVCCRIYDKVAEMRFHGRWHQWDRWRGQRLPFATVDDVAPPFRIWRCEFEMGRHPLQRIGCRTVRDLDIAGLWALLTRRWFRIVERASRLPRSRSSANAFWVAVQGEPSDRGQAGAELVLNGRC